MLLPNPADTIYALATSCAPAPLALLRISGARAWSLAQSIGCPPPHGAAQACTSARLTLPETGTFPALCYWFARPRSYSGDDLVELYLPGSPPLLRSVQDALRRGGARPALAGEFTARRFLSGRLDASEVEPLLDLFAASDASALRAAQRGERGRRGACVATCAEQLGELLARVEAGIDFTDEEDVQFVSAQECRTHCARIRGGLEALAAGGAAQERAAVPHVVLAGLPNAGKSTLFNALLARERALVAPVAGTTRDLLTDVLDLDGMRVLLVDTAGAEALPADADAPGLLAQRAAADAQASADVLIWVQAIDTEWSVATQDLLARSRSGTRILVRSKCDLPTGPCGTYSQTGDSGAARPAHGAAVCVAGFDACVSVSAAQGAGLAELRSLLRRMLGATRTAPSRASADLTEASDALLRAEGLCGDEPALQAELLAVELRLALAALDRFGRPPSTEELLGLIFGRFCIGK